MAMKVLFIYYLCASLFTIGITSTISGKEDLRCYVCELEQTEACDDPPDISILTSAECSTLQYSSPRTEIEGTLVEDTISKGADDKFQGGPILNEILRGADKKRDASSFKYVCLKVTFSAGQKTSIRRTCEKVPDDVKNVCKYINKEVDSGVKVRSCNYCENDNCNSGSYIFCSKIIIFISISLLLLKQNF